MRARIRSTGNDKVRSYTRAEAEEYLDHVGIKDNVIRRITYQEAHQQGLRHRAVHVFLFEEDNYSEMTIALRSALKADSGLKWHSAVSEHVKFGEFYEKAARRGVKEELFEGKQSHVPPKLSLEGLCAFRNDSHRWNKENAFLYRFVYSGQLFPDRQEIDSMEKRDVQRIFKEMDHPTLRYNYSPDFTNAMMAYKGWLGRV